MNTITDHKINVIQREKQRLGLVYGILAGTGFALTAWGLDAIQLAQANAYLPWGKFVVGWLASMILGGLAGWISARLDNSLVAVLVWIATGFTLAMGIGWLAYQGVVHLYDWFDPDIASYLDYSLNPAIEIRTGIAAVASGLIGVAVSIFQLNRLDSAIASAYPLQRLLNLSGGVLVFAVAGLISNGLIQSKLSEPVVQIDTALKYAVEHRGQTLEIHEARQHGQTALRALGDLQYQHYRLVVSSYDDYLSMIWVTLDFGEIQTRCSVLEKNISYCETPAAINPTNPTGQIFLPNSSESASAPAIRPTETAGGASPSLPDQTQEILPLASLADQADKLSGFNHYYLQVSMDPEQRSFQGQLNLDYTNSENTSLDRLFFRLLPNGHRSYGNGSLQVNEIKIAGIVQPVHLSQEDTVLEINLGEELEPGEDIQIALLFQGQIPLDFGGGANSSGYGIYNYTDEVMALASWYPILAVYDDRGWHLDPVSYIGDSVYSDMASYEVEVKLPVNQVLVSTGVIQDITSEGAWQRYRIESGPVRDFFLISSPHFKSLTSEIDGARVSSYFLPEYEAGGQRALEIARQAIEIFSRQFSPYPYPEMDLVGAPLQNASGVEYPGIILIGDFLYPDYDQVDFEVTIAHEVAHQWWYNLVGNDVFADPWLDEALASYSSGLYLEATAGRAGMSGLMSYYQQRYQRILDNGSDHPISESLAYFENDASPGAYGGIVYAKGALFLDAVRQEIGDQAFFAALQNYFRRFQYSIAKSESLLDAFETAAGRPLDDLYQTWKVSP